MPRGWTIAGQPAPPAASGDSLGGAVWEMREGDQAHWAIPRSPSGSGRCPSGRVGEQREGDFGMLGRI